MDDSTDEEDGIMDQEMGQEQEPEDQEEQESRYQERRITGKGMRTGSPERQEINRKEEETPLEPSEQDRRPRTFTEVLMKGRKPSWPQEKEAEPASPGKSPGNSPGK